MSASTHSPYNVSRAFEPGSRRFPRLRRVLVPAALVAGLLTGCGAAEPASEHASGCRARRRRRSRAACGRRRPRSTARCWPRCIRSATRDARYGSIPAYLRNKQAAPANQILSATAAHPAIAIQGNSVVLHLAHGSALATAVGPDVPDRIQGSADLHTPATWDLTFADVHGTVPISPRLFTITDEQGMLLLPHVSVLGGGPLPKIVPAGRPFTLRLTTVVSVGDGKLRYAPAGGPWLAEWDFDVETD